MIPKEIQELIKWECYPEDKHTLGGQHVGTIITGKKLICKEIGFEIATDNYKSQIKNMNLCLLLFELYLQEIKVI